MIGRRKLTALLLGSALVASGVSAAVGHASDTANGRFYFSRDVVPRGAMADIFSVGPQGGGMRREVGSKRAAEYSLDVSVAGSRLVFQRIAARKSTSGIYVLSLSSGAIGRVTSGLGDSFPAFAGRGASVVFSDGDNGDIFRSSLGGGAPERIARSKRNRTFSNPEVSNDGGRMLVETERDFGGSEIMIMNARGEKREKLTATKAGSSFNPSFSPDGRQIVFERFSAKDGSSARVRSAVYSMTSEGRKLARLTSLRHDSSRPVFSPDGNRIAFIRDRSIYTMRATGGHLQRITSKHPGTIDEIAWAVRP